MIPPILRSIAIIKDQPSLKPLVNPLTRRRLHRWNFGFPQVPPKISQSQWILPLEILNQIFDKKRLPIYGAEDGKVNTFFLSSNPWSACSQLRSPAPGNGPFSLYSALCERCLDRLCQRT